jgi:hypothetical protein
LCPVLKAACITAANITFAIPESRLREAEVPEAEAEPFGSLLTLLFVSEGSSFLDLTSEIRNIIKIKQWQVRHEAFMVM